MREREDLIEKAKRHKHRREGREEVESRASPSFSLCVQPKLPFRFPQNIYQNISLSLSLSLPLPLLRANQVNILPLATLFIYSSSYYTYIGIGWISFSQLNAHAHRAPVGHTLTSCCQPYFLVLSLFFST